VSKELKRELQQIAPPEELEAQRRAWSLVRGAFEEREPVAWHTRNMRPLALAAAALVVLLIAVLSPPGRALVGEVQDAVSDEPAPKPKPVLASLPTRGLLLVNSPRGPWIVRPDGSRRLLGRYWEGSWSPKALHILVSRARELRALDPKGNTRWAIGRPRRISGARWSPDGFRVSYLSGSELRVVAGDGTGDKVLRNRVALTAPAWRPGAGHELVFGTVDGQIALANTDTGVTRWRAPVGEPATQLAWSEDGQRLLALGERYLRIFDGDGNELSAVGLPLGPAGVAFVRKSHRFVLIRWQPATGRSELVLMDAEGARGEERSLFSAAGEFRTMAVSPNGRWLIVGWVGADQWLFLRLDVLRVRAVSNIAEQFGGPPGDRPLSAHFPASVSWCCPASP
jgi:dipeptidyl aminopeptidase/acylaminoacyl peptidase